MHFDVPMNNIGSMDGLQGTKSLINKVLEKVRLPEEQKTKGFTCLAMVITEALSSDHSVQISLHELLDNCTHSKREVILQSCNHSQ